MALNQFTNNAATTLASSITSSATSLTVITTTGGLFPTLTGSQYFYCTLSNTSGSVIEIIKVTSRSSDTFTIVRGQDNTSASNFSAGDKVELRVTAIDLNNFPQLDSTNTFAAAQTFTSNPIMSGLTASKPVFTDASKNLTNTGTLGADQGGTGVAGTLTGILYGNATSPQTVATTAQVINTLGTLTANNVLLGNGTSALQVVAPGTSGNVLTSNGTTWTSAASTSGGMTLLGTITPTAVNSVSLGSLTLTSYKSLYIIFNGISVTTKPVIFISSSNIQTGGGFCGTATGANIYSGTGWLDLGTGAIGGGANAGNVTNNGLTAGFGGLTNVSTSTTTLYFRFTGTDAFTAGGSIVIYGVK